MKILIVDDHALFRDGLCHVLQGLDDQVNLLEAPDYDRAMRVASETPDLGLVLLDLDLPGKDGFTALDSFGRYYPTIPVVILSASVKRGDIQRALDAGAMGYIPKESTSSVMLNALRLTLTGDIYVPPNMLQTGQPEYSGFDNNSFALTQRQLEVLAMLVRGCSNKEIAAQMQLAEATVKMHVTSILKRLNVSNRTQAAIVAEKLGMELPAN